MRFLTPIVAGLAVGSAALHVDSEYKKFQHEPITRIQLGPRPYYLTEDLDDGPLKKKLQSCANDEMRPSKWSLGHRGGGTLQIPEHSLQSSIAGARMGAGILECDVAFTKDRQLVCRHSQCDLHTTTNIVNIPELNAKCTQPFQPAADGKPASAKCCTSDITLKEFKSLCAKMDGANTTATTPEDYLHGTPAWRTDLYATCATILSLKEHIALTDSLGLDFTPELKKAEVEMPFEGDYTQEDYAQQMIDEFKEMGIKPSRVWAQSFQYSDILYWLKKEPEFGEQAVYLDEKGSASAALPAAVEKLAQYKEDGVRIVAPPLSYLVTYNDDDEIVPSKYATEAKKLGLDIISWSLERSPPISSGAAKDLYYGSVAKVLKRDGDMYKLVDVLWQQVGIIGLFSDWSATVTYYANCFDIKLV
ncbi:PLC-like phosphodiesterase [Mariannaea sp. PMI_226]|nr:PLC-like phosphodiesterase [Mariannaea sp. PMI_226]